MTIDRGARPPMRPWCAMALMAALCGCSGDDPDDVAEVKTALPMDRVPAAALKAAREKDPSLTFFAAYKGTFEGRESIELKGKTRAGKIKEIEVSPDGRVLGVE